MRNRGEGGEGGREEREEERRGIKNESACIKHTHKYNGSDSYHCSVIQRTANVINGSCVPFHNTYTYITL